VIVRFSKVILVASIALFAGVVGVGNIVDYDTNFAFVQHVLAMDTVFPDALIRSRAINDPLVHRLAYLLIITAEIITALICGVGVIRMMASALGTAADFNRSKGPAIIGLTLGFLLWQVGFMTIGGEWFGMWMSHDWNGVPSAFRFAIVILAVLIYVALPDSDD
jgi:predicted small integral membrane protein